MVSDRKGESFFHPALMQNERLCNLQCGTSTWFRHFATFSGLDEDCIGHLSMGDYRLKVRMLLRVEGPRIFHVDKFTKKNGLFTFTFVRHPFERSISEIQADNFDHTS